MNLVKIQLRGFRNHNDTTMEFGDGTNIILGDNGGGKTNILEGISYLCLTKSFYASSDSIVLGFGKEMFEVEGDMISDANVERHIRLAYGAEPKQKVYTLNKRRVESFSSVIGRFPIVILSPEHTPITFGPPAARRKFTDLVMCQSSLMYLEDLLEYRRILKQRNKILLDARLTNSSPWLLLEPWNHQIATVGAKVMYRRKEFLNQFQSYMTSAYRHITDDAEEPGAHYMPATKIEEASTIEDIAELLQSEIEEKKREEVRLGATIVGPHRDEFALTINGFDLRRFASQGQHKTFLIALKVGEFFYLKEKCRETPIFLLDDVFSELDEHRTRRVLNFVGELSQTFITSTNYSIFDDAITFGDRNRKFLVSNGTVVYENV